MTSHHQEVPRLWHAVLPLHMLTDVQNAADRLSDCPNHWVDRDTVEAGDGTTAAERVVSQLHTLIRSMLPENWVGAEYWVQVYAAGRGLAFHFDKDEHVMKEEGRMVNPLLSSVLYLTGGGDSALQAPTVVTDQSFDHGAGCPVPEHPTCSTLVFPRRNSYVLFDGALGHGVLDCGADGRRATLLVNWWATKPQAVDRAEAEAELAVGVSHDEKEAPDEVAVATVALAGGDLDEEATLLVDDVLLSHGLATAGPEAVHAVCIKHAGLSLCPIDLDQLRQSGGQVQVGAAFLSTSGLASSSSSSSEEG